VFFVLEVFDPPDIFAEGDDKPAQLDVYEDNQGKASLLRLKSY